MARRWATLFAVAAALFCCGVAAAQTADEALQQVREKFERGQTLFEQGKYADAAAEFRAAYEIKPVSALIFNEAVCYERLHDASKAASLFNKYLEQSPQATDRDAVKARIANLSSPTPAAPTAAPPPEQKLRAIVFIDSNPPGATIYLDDKKNTPLGTTPWNGTIEGTHTVIVAAPGYREERKQITAKPEAVTQLYIALSADQYLGWLEVRSDVAAADVYIDNTTSGAVGRTPYMGNLTPGKHTITVDREGFVPVEKTIDVVAGQATKLDLHLEEAPIGFVAVNGQVDGATVKVDGKKVCEAPCRFHAPVGQHSISVSRGGMKSYSQKIYVERATQTDMHVRLMPTQPKYDVIWKLGGGALIVGGGIWLTMHGNDLLDGIDKDKAAMPKGDFDARTTQAKALKYGGYAAIALGGVAIASGVIALVSERGPASTGTSSRRDLGRAWLVVPVVGSGEAGVVAMLRF